MEGNQKVGAQQTHMVKYFAGNFSRARDHLCWHSYYSMIIVAAGSANNMQPVSTLCVVGAACK